MPVSVAYPGGSRRMRRLLKCWRQPRSWTERCEVELLWKNSNPNLQNNYSSTLSQMKSHEHRLEKGLQLNKWYQENTDVDVVKGLVRIWDQVEFETTKTDLQWCTLHHTEVNSNKRDKVRRVCNAASKSGGFPLNDILRARPDLLQKLIGIIFRFHEKQIALTAEVEAIFLQVKLPLSDFKVPRFLWRENNTKPILVYEWEHIFGPEVRQLLSITLCNKCDEIAETTLDWSQCW